MKPQDMNDEHLIKQIGVNPFTTELIRRYRSLQEMRIEELRVAAVISEDNRNMRERIESNTKQMLEAKDALLSCADTIDRLRSDNSALRDAIQSLQDERKGDLP